MRNRMPIKTRVVPRNPVIVGIFALIMNFLPIAGNCKTIYVPADSATIQAGIDGAVDGDTVLVAPGLYTGPGNEGINFGGKNIVLKSEAGADDQYRLRRRLNLHRRRLHHLRRL